MGIQQPLTTHARMSTTIQKRDSENTMPVNAEPVLKKTKSTEANFESSKATVLRMFDDWGNGRMCDEGRDAVLAADFAADCILDVSAAMKNTDGYKIYNGTAECGKLFDFLTVFDFPDFQVLTVSPGAEPSKVLVQVSYTPTMKANGKTGALMSDLQEWPSRATRSRRGRSIGALRMRS